MNQHTQTLEINTPETINQEVLLQGQVALAELCAIEVPMGANGTGSMEGRANSYNPLEPVHNVGSLAANGRFIHDEHRDRLMAQKQNHLTVNALRGLREIIIAREDKDAPEAERQYGLSLLVTSKGTVVSGAAYRHDGYGQSSTKEFKDAADFGEKEWQTLATAAAEVREGKMQLTPQPYTRSRYPFGLSGHYHSKALGIEPR